MKKLLCLLLCMTLLGSAAIAETVVPVTSSVTTSPKTDYFDFATSSAEKPKRS